MAGVLRNLGSRRCFVVHGHDGLDELTITGPSHVAELADGNVREYDFSPEDVGLSCARLEELVADGEAHSAAVLRGVLAGEKGPCRDVVLLNAGAAIAAAGAAESIGDGIQRAAESIDGGGARQALETLVRLSNES